MTTETALEAITVAFSPVWGTWLAIQTVTGLRTISLTFRERAERRRRGLRRARKAPRRLPLHPVTVKPRTSAATRTAGRSRSVSRA